MQIKNLRHPQLRIDSFTGRVGETWCLYGLQDSGINEFLLLLEDKLSPDNAEILQLPASPIIVSFARQQQIYEQELREDDSDFLDAPDPGTPAADFLPESMRDSDLIDSFNMRELMTTGYRQLSSGQSRKLLILQALLSDTNVIILDSPYDGLDRHTRIELDKAFARLQRVSHMLFVLVRNQEDIPHWCSHLAVFNNSALSGAGLKTTILPTLDPGETRTKPLFQASLKTYQAAGSQTQPGSKELVVLKNGFASYGAKQVFTGLDLVVCQGDHTLITGPNGCGKSTLLHIITGDNPKCYANTLYICGRRRGTGESIWDLKKHMGIVSPEIHRSYRVPGSTLSVIVSGLFDSIGLYKQPNRQQLLSGRRWLTAIGLGHLAGKPFRQLPYGEQRLVLIARAMIKEPPLLILDEPTQGLDSPSRKALLDFLDFIACQGSSTILYVSHREDEYRNFFRQHIQLEKYN